MRAPVSYSHPSASCTTSQFAWTCPFYRLSHINTPWTSTTRTQPAYFNRATSRLPKSLDNMPVKRDSVSERGRATTRGTPNRGTSNPVSFPMALYSATLEFGIAESGALMIAAARTYSWPPKYAGARQSPRPGATKCRASFQIARSLPSNLSWGLYRGLSQCLALPKPHSHRRELHEAVGKLAVDEVSRYAFGVRSCPSPQHGRDCRHLGQPPESVGEVC